MFRSFFKICCLTVVMLVFVPSCSEKTVEEEIPTINNPVSLITDKAKLRMLAGIVPIDGDGRLYEMDYTVDYMLDELLQSDNRDLLSMLDFLVSRLLDKASEIPEFVYCPGCSSFAVSESGTSNYLAGRNFDLVHSIGGGPDVPIAAILLRTAPKNGKKAVSIVDPYFFGVKKSFLNDGKTDLSLLMLAPYAMMDGMNEDGFSVSALVVDGNYADQKDAAKKGIWVTPLMRMLLDKAGTVKEAIEMLQQYNACMNNPINSSFHFFIADATGDYAIIEYSYSPGEDKESVHPGRFLALTGNDTLRYVTNFYVDPFLADWKHGGQSRHGRDRYDILKKELKSARYSLSREDAMKMLSKVSQSSDPAKPSSHTQWSVVYRLSERLLDVSIVQQYDTVRTFSVI